MPYFGAEFETIFIYKVYIYLPRINTKRLTTALFDDTPVISSCDHGTTGLYQWSANCWEGECNSDIIRLLQQSHTIHYCNQSVLEIFTDLNIFVFSITIFDLILRSDLVRFSLLPEICMHNSTGLRFYKFCFVTRITSS